jgi:hypothetical protein
MRGARHRCLRRGEAALSEQPPNKQRETGIVILYHGCHKNECRTIRSGDLGMNPYSILRYSSGCGERTGRQRSETSRHRRSRTCSSARRWSHHRPTRPQRLHPGELQCLARHPHNFMSHVAIREAPASGARAPGRCRTSRASSSAEPRRMSSTPCNGPQAVDYRCEVGRPRLASAV